MISLVLLQLQPYRRNRDKAEGNTLSKVEKIHFNPQICACIILGTNSDAQNTCAGTEIKWDGLIHRPSTL